MLQICGESINTPQRISFSWQVAKFYETVELNLDKK